MTTTQKEAQRLARRWDRADKRATAANARAKKAQHAYTLAALAADKARGDYYDAAERAKAEHQELLARISKGSP